MHRIGGGGTSRRDEDPSGAGAAPSPEQPTLTDAAPGALPQAKKDTCRGREKLGNRLPAQLVEAVARSPNIKSIAGRGSSFDIYNALIRSAGQAQFLFRTVSYFIEEEMCAGGRNA